MVSNVLQTAIYQLLQDSAALMSVVKGIYDEIPQELSEQKIPDDKYYPIIEFGDFQELPWDSDAVLGLEININLNIYSTYKGNKEINDIKSIVTQLLHYKKIPLLGFQDTSCIFIDSQIFKDPDGLTRHGVLQFKFLTRQL